MPAYMKGTIKRSVFGNGGTAFNIEISAAGLTIREPRKKAYGPIPWNRIFQFGAQITADSERVRPKKITRGLLTTSVLLLGVLLGGCTVKGEPQPEGTVRDGAVVTRIARIKDCDVYRVEDTYPIRVVICEHSNAAAAMH